IGTVDELAPPQAPGAATGLEAALITRQPVVFSADGRPQAFDTAFYDRGKLGAGQVFEGPAIIEQYDSTVVVPPRFSGRINEVGNMVIDVPAKEAGGETLSTPILMRVVGGALSSAAKEMASVLFRMSYSSIIRESEDLGAGLFDRHGNVLAESDSTPMFMGAMPKIIRGVMSVLGEDINEGDIILHNDP
ncbi:hydantoinase B/oxoprolinase family protein, partial [Thermocatellispora tengchongensis]|uniref:hydantoinase B/oxoprolinase family protein n=1 Tax=Thermocatellispora tengchongensis TaxID=1073253 RepID=UPI0031E8A242